MIIKVRGKENRYWHLFDKVNDLSYTNIGAATNLDESQLWEEDDIQRVIKILKSEVSSDDTYIMKFLKENEGHSLIFNTYGFVMNDRGETIEKVGQKTKNQSGISDDKMKDRYQELAGIKNEDVDSFNDSKANRTNNGVDDFRSRKLSSIKESIKKVRSMGNMKNRKYDRSDIERWIDEQTIGPTEMSPGVVADKLEDQVVDNEEVKTLEEWFEENNIEGPGHRKGEGLCDPVEDTRDLNPTSFDGPSPDFAEMDLDKEEEERIKKKIKELKENGDWGDAPEPGSKGEFFKEEDEEVEEKLDKFRKMQNDESSELFRNRKDDVTEGFPEEEKFTSKEVKEKFDRATEEFEEVEKDEKTLKDVIRMNREKRTKKTVEEIENELGIDLEYEVREESEDEETDTRRVTFDEESSSDETLEEENRESDEDSFVDTGNGGSSEEETKTAMETISGNLQGFLDDVENNKDLKEGFMKSAGIDPDEAEEVEELLTKFREEQEGPIEEYRDKKAEEIASTLQVAQESISKDELENWLGDGSVRRVKAFSLQEDFELEFESYSELEEWFEESDYKLEDLKFVDITNNSLPAKIEPNNTKRVIFGSKPGFQYE